MDYNPNVLSKVLPVIKKELELGNWPGIVFVRKRSEAWSLAQTLSLALGEPVMAVTAQVSPNTRKDIASKMSIRDPLTRVVVSTSTWSTGIDIPSLRFVVLTTGRAPIGLIQSAGRGARMDTDKPGYTVYSVGSDDNAHIRKTRLQKELGLDQSLFSEMSAYQASPATRPCRSATPQVTTPRQVNQYWAPAAPKKCWHSPFPFWQVWFIGLCLLGLLDMCPGK
jgi:superfamily II DNA helicase RecQ